MRDRKVPTELPCVSVGSVIIVIFGGMGGIVNSLLFFVGFIKSLVYFFSFAQKKVNLGSKCNKAQDSIVF